MNSVHLAWSEAGCANAAKIKFFRPSTRLTLVAERGPFTISGRDVVLTLSPPVPIMSGDVIGVTRLTNCGAPMRFYESQAQYATFSSDFVGPYVDGFNSVFGMRLAISGTGVLTQEVLRGVVPVVGSAAGTAGSNFRTSMQMMNTATTGAPITGRLVFHPSGTAGNSADPSTTYTLNPGQVLAYPDISNVFGRTGLGSVDLMTTQTAALPMIVTTVFNDAGAAGTSGFTEDVIEVADRRVLNAGATGFLVLPADVVRTRFNIGVRTLSGAVTLTAVVRDSNGIVLRTVSKSYQGNWFEQVSASSFFGGAPINSNQSIGITVASGSVVVYGTTTDNITNDPTIQYARAQ